MFPPKPDRVIYLKLSVYVLKKQCSGQRILEAKLFRATAQAFGSWRTKAAYNFLGSSRVHLERKRMQADGDSYAWHAAIGAKGKPRTTQLEGAEFARMAILTFQAQRKKSRVAAGNLLNVLGTIMVWHQPQEATA
jgi:hypothetical protein